MSLQKQISQAVRRRNGKKYMISKMIIEIEELVEQKGSRTQIRYLKSSLAETLKNAVTLHEALMVLLSEDDPRFNDDWIDELSLKVNTCFGSIERYLLDRKDDPPSSLLSSQKRKDIQRWRENSQNQSQESSLSDMCDAFSKLYVEQSNANEISRNKTQTETLQKNVTSLFNPDESELSKNTTSGELKVTASEHGGARPRDRTRESISIPEISSVDNNVKTYLNPNINEFTPMTSKKSTVFFEPYTYDQFHSTYTVPRTYYSNQFDLRESYLPKSNLVSSTLTHHVNVTSRTLPLQATISSTLPPHVNVTSSTLSLHDNVYSSATLTHHANVVSSSTLPSRNNVNLTTLPLQTNVVSSTLPYEISKKSKVVQFGTKPKQETSNIHTEGHKSLDHWIDELDPNNLIIHDTTASRNIQMELLIQQRLPRQELITFSGEADKWVEFVSKFYDIVHKQPYLDSFQKRTYLTQQLKGEALRAVEGFANDDQGYVNSLKKLKFLFGNKVLVAQSVIRKITKSKQKLEFFQ